MQRAAHDLRTLQLGPLWVLSALAGTGNRFEPAELDAFWDAVVDVTLRTTGTAREVLASITEDRSGLLLDFELDDRSVVSGLTHVVAALDSRDREMADAYKLALLRIGTGVGRARGPYGRKITAEDTQTLLLVAELLEIESVPPVADDVLV